MRIDWHGRALQDLDNNISHIAKESPQNALHVLDTITGIANGLGNMPYKYPKEPVYNTENVRFVAKWHFKIIYRVETDRIYILRVFSTHQHPDKIKE